ncbi:hypothetical protein ID857_19280 [Xenorhabdus sp. CUL]|nr:hypothetical protein [Xenorhabdus sp. CUL]
MTAGFVQGKPPQGAAWGGDGEHGNERGAKRLRAVRSQCSGVGAGEVKPEAAGRPAFRGVGWTLHGC